VVLEDSTVVANRAYSGAAVWTPSALTVTRSLIEDDDAVGSAALRGSPVTVTDSTLTDNAAHSSAAIEAIGAAVLDNVTIDDNDSTGNAIDNGIVWATASISLRHTTITASGSSTGATLHAPTIEAEASVLVNGQQAECMNGATVTSHGGNLARGGSCPFTEPTDHTFVNDPQLGDLADNGGPVPTRRPEPGSPALDRVAPADCDPTLTRDARGLPRPRGSGCDAGAVELQARPDGSIRRGNGPLRGNGVYNTTTVGQARTVVADRGDVVRFNVRIDNDGELTEDLVVKAPRALRSVSARYLVGGQDVTPAVVAGRPFHLAPGASAALGIALRVAGNAPHGFVRDIIVRVRSPFGSNVEDRVRGTVRVR
jgi:hypothetical protein